MIQRLCFNRIPDLLVVIEKIALYGEYFFTNPIPSQIFGCLFGGQMVERIVERYRLFFVFLPIVLFFANLSVDALLSNTPFSFFLIGLLSLGGFPFGILLSYLVIGLQVRYHNLPSVFGKYFFFVFYAISIIILLQISVWHFCSITIFHSFFSACRGFPARETIVSFAPSLLPAFTLGCTYCNYLIWRQIGEKRKEK